jgi:hypothetical protein
MHHALYSYAHMPSGRTMGVAILRAPRARVTNSERVKRSNRSNRVGKKICYRAAYVKLTCAKRDYPSTLAK